MRDVLTCGIYSGKSLDWTRSWGFGVLWVFCVCVCACGCVIARSRLQGVDKTAPVVGARAAKVFGKRHTRRVIECLTVRAPRSLFGISARV